MDPIAVGAWLLALVSSPAAAPIAVLSLLVNVYLWRELRAASQALLETKAAEIERLRGEVERTRTVDNQVMREMTGLLKMWHERGEQQRTEIVARTRRSARDGG